MGTLQPVLAIKLYLELILTINRIDESRYFDEYTYETASECLLLYESQISDSTTKQVILELIINSCLTLHCLSNENYDILLSNITSYCSKILKKNEQCQILLSCCYLFTNPQVYFLSLRPTPTASTKSSRDVPSWPIPASTSPSLT